MNMDDNNNLTENPIIETLKKIKIGSRADVYEGRAQQTVGGLTKNDIICKIMGKKKLYISQKVSNRMKEVMTEMIKRKTKHATQSILKKSNLTNSIIPNQPENTSPNITNNNTSDKIDLTDSTQSSPPIKLNKKTVKFALNYNIVKNFTYDELNGINLEQLRREMNEENNETESSSITPKEFTIETLDDCQLNEDLNNKIN